jgi:hypothetical protein
MEIVKEEDIDKRYLAPELYYEYIRGTVEGIIKEVWCVGENRYLDFVTGTNNYNKDIERTAYFKIHKVTPLYLKSYIVPPSWFDIEISRMGER